MSLFENAGAPPQKQPKYSPVFQSKYFTGLWTNRDPLHNAADVISERYYGGKQDALLGGKNTELRPTLRLGRRYGLSKFSDAIYPTTPLRAYPLQLADGSGQIQVIVDCGTTGNLAVSSVANASAGSSVYAGVFGTAAATNGFVGLVFKITGFVNNQNNGTFTCTASTSTTLTLSNTQGVSETTAANAISAGATFYDQQSAGNKTLLFAKQPGAGQTGFVGVGGILYAGDGVSTWKYVPGNTNSTPPVYNWGIAAPSSQPSVTIVPSGAASVQWTASTVFSTMGILVDSNGNIEQLNSVNASLTNTTQFGNSGNGQPNFSLTPGGSTTDNTVTWVNAGPIVLWTANTQYGNFTTGGTAATPCCIYDPNTKSCYIQSNPGQTTGTSGSSYPKFVASPGASVHDGSVKWIYIGSPNGNGQSGIPGQWQANHVYPTQGTATNNEAVSCISIPVSLANGLPSNQTVYLQKVTTGGTSGASGTNPTWSTLAGTLTNDNDLIWLNCGSATWAATTNYSAWTASGSIFSAVKDSNGNIQVCVTGGASATVQPGTSFTLSAAGTASGGQTTYTGTFSPTIPVGNGNLSVVISGFSNAANNGTFTIVSCSSTQLVVKNASGVSESHAATAVYNNWGIGYGVQTKDGTAVWVNVGNSMSWAASTKWFLPTSGFNPPSSASPFGGASVIDSNNDVEFIVNSGKTGAAHPTWAAIGSYTAEGTALTLTQVTVSGSTTTYTGTITGGSANGLAGKSFVIVGFTNVGNNTYINVTASTATTLVCTTTSQVNETHAGTATGGANPIWYNLEAFSANSLAWTSGYVYAYSYKSRSLTDFYSTPDSTGQLPVPPGLSNALPAPTGSLTGAISSASPVFTITGSDAGAVNTITGLGSTDPQVDTIVLWRSSDGGGSANMFELSELPNPKPIGGIAQPFVFKDFLPDAPTAVFPGLNELIPAPIDDVNDPPPTGFIPHVFNFQRIWGAVGSEVFFSSGPDQESGANPNEAFNPADELPFLAPVTRIVRASQGLVTFTNDSIEIVLGGPSTSSFYSVNMIPSIGLLSFNALDVQAGEIIFFGSDQQLHTISPSLNFGETGFGIADQLANLPVSGVSDATWNPATAYLAAHQAKLDTAIFLADGSTGWYRQNPFTVGGISTDPTWSPFAGISNGCTMVESVETAPGIRQLLVGPTGGGKILVRDLTKFDDNGTQYEAHFDVGSLVLCKPGQIAALKFFEGDFGPTVTSSTATISYLLNEISGTFKTMVGPPVFDPPEIYGQTIKPTSYSPLRYYFASNGSLAKARHMQIRVSFGTTNHDDYLTNFTLNGKLVIEN